MSIAKKLKTMIAFTLFVGVFLFSTAEMINANANQPIVMAWINGESLHISVSGGQRGIDTVYINNSRVNYRVGGSFNVPLRSYAGTGEFIRVYAIDLAGNLSNTIVIENPFYVAPSFIPAIPFVTPRPPSESTTVPLTQIQNTSQPPTSQSGIPTSGNPFTPDGTGTVVDNAVDGDGKEFFTVATEDGHDFFLIVDRQRRDNNVYLLNTVTEEDLLSLARSSGNVNQSAIPTPAPTPAPTPNPQTTQNSETETSNNSGNTGSIITILILVLGVGGAGYYFKIMKPKQEASNTDHDENVDEDDEDETEGESEETESDSETAEE